MIIIKCDTCLEEIKGEAPGVLQIASPYPHQFTTTPHIPAKNWIFCRACAVKVEQAVIKITKKK